MNINKSHLLIHVICIFMIFCFYFKSYVFLIMALLLCADEIKKNLHHLLFIFISSIALIFVEFENFKEYLLMTFSIILFSSKLSKDILYVLKVYSIYISTLILSVLIVGVQKYGDFQDVLTFQSRLWLILPDGKEFNPNPLGILCAISTLGFLVNKKYFFSLFPLIILLLTQSRAAIIFLVISYIFSYRLTFKNILLISFSLVPFLYIIMISDLSNRFTNDGENGRLERSYLYFNIIKNNYLLGYPINDYLYFSSLYGSLDNMYLLMILQYGIVGLLFFLYIIYLKATSKKDNFYRLRSSIFWAIMIYGLFEGGIPGMFLMWIIFALCFTNLGKGSIRLH